MRQLSLLALAFIIFIGFAGCKKDTITYTITGNVMDLSFNQHLAGATITVTTVMASSNSGGITKTFTTDANGNYSFSFERGKIESITLELSKDNYFGKTVSYTLDNLSFKQDNVVDFSCYAKAWVKMRFLGNGANEYKYSRSQGLSNCAECCSGTEQTLYDVVDESVYCINNGNSIYEIYWNVPNTSYNGQASVTTTPFDTTEMVISY
jgi:hypothetical protein